MALSDKQKLELLFLRVSAIEKHLEDTTEAFAGGMENFVVANTTDEDIKAEVTKIRPVKEK